MKSGGNPIPKGRGFRRALFDDWKAIKSRIVIENEHVKLLAKISIEIDIASDLASFTLPDFGLAAKETMIDENIWHLYKDELIGVHEV